MEKRLEESGIAWWFMRASVLYLSSAGNVEASVSLGSAGTLGQHSISMLKIILPACCDKAFVRTALKSPEYGDIL